MTHDVVAFPVRRRIRLPHDVYCSEHAFLVTLSTADRFPWFSLHPDLAASAATRQSSLYAWCMMPDHVHVLAQDANLIQFVRLFKGRLTPLARQLRREKPLWQRSFHDHGLRREESVEHVAQYIFENPVRAGLVAAAEDYPWSGSTVWPRWR